MSSKGKTKEFHQRTHYPLPPFTEDCHPVRLLHLQPSDDNSAELRCTTYPVDLLNDPQFTALSYVWGDPAVTMPIVVNGALYYVTSNCYAALVRLRAIRKTDLWIDAICINQEDNTEKATQIPLMGDIYSQAQTVFVWLGRPLTETTSEDEEKEILAFGLAEDIIKANVFEGERIKDDDLFFMIAMYGQNPAVPGRSYISATSNGITKLAWPTDLSNLQNPQAQSADGLSGSSDLARNVMDLISGRAKRRWSAFKHILDHRWFTRLWVQQEVVLAKKLTYLTQYGTGQFWHILMAAVYAGHHLTKAVLCPPYIDNGLWPVLRGSLERVSSMYNSRMKMMDLHSEPSEWRNTLLSSLRSTSAFDCFNPRDRVYAILGVVNELSKEQKANIIIDYDMSIVDVYANVARVVIETSNCLEVICGAGMSSPERQNRDGFPSWVYDWRPDGSGDLAQNNIIDNWSKLYNASAKAATNFAFSRDGLQLVVQGLSKDTVLESMAPFDNQSGLVTEFVTMLHRIGVASLTLWAKHFDVYPTGCSPEFAWLRTISMDRMSLQMKVLTRQSEEQRSQLEQMYRINGPEEYHTRDLLAVLGVELAASRDFVPSERAMERMKDWLFTLVGSMDDMTFFISRSGYMGLASTPPRAGDLVCLVPGCTVPLLIRKEGDHHTLVSDCFVWGLMDGEAFEGKDEGDIEWETFRLH